MKRVAFLFGREKVTSVVRSNFEALMRNCSSSGITRKDGFLYWQRKEVPMLRVPYKNASIVREIKYIPLEELAIGMKEILRQNVSVEKNGLFRLLVQQLGFSRIGDAISDRLEAALLLISKEVEFDGNMLSLKTT